MAQQHEANGNALPIFNQTEMKPKIVIIGAGGHGKVIADTILKQNKYTLVGFIDAKFAIGTPVFGDFCVIEKQENLLEYLKQVECVAIAIGDGAVRKQMVSFCSDFTQFATIIHPNATISNQVQIGEGSVVLAGAIINASAEIGKHSIINSGVVVDHDCMIGDFVHLKVGTIVGSNSILQNHIVSEIGQLYPSFTII